MALINHPALAGKLVHAWTEPCKRDMREHGGESTAKIEDTRFRFVVDEGDNLLATVTDKYRLVRNADLVSAAEIAAEARGLTLEPAKGKLSGYSGGRSKYTFHIPELEYQVSGDPSKMHPTLVLGNDYRGAGGLRVSTGYYRLVCTNGAIAGTVAYRDFKRHVGHFDLLQFVGAAVDRLHDIFEADRLAAETLASTPIVAGQTELVARMDETTPARYQDSLHRAVRENTIAMGENAWAYVQAVAEVATHRMQRRERFNHAADPWAARMEAIIREYAELS